MKKKTIASGLAGLILATAPISFNSCSKNNFPQPTLGISRVEYQNHESNSNYKIEMQEPFGKTNFGNETYIYDQNTDEQNGELPFILYKSNETEVIVGGPKTHIKGKGYIPTRASNSKENQVFNKFEIYGLDAKIVSNLEKRMKKESKKSESDFGYNYFLTSEDIKEILPSTIINGQEYIHWPLQKGKLTNENGEKFNYKKGMIDKIIMPLTDLCDEDGIGINLENGKLTLYRDCGFYIPVEESLQTDAKDISCGNNKNPADERNYVIIEKGQTAWGIWGSDWEKIQELNPEKDLNKINPGDKIFTE